ncbi:MAG TPA: hypothetical protein VKI99_14270 [Candidatus Dormibacteraeota bacterium]|nr:hypothetical protein [Candidatus Dormibacteraeota bacterium]
MASGVLPHVETIRQKDNGSVVLDVLVVGFTPDQEVEISGYITQTNGTYASFNIKKKVPHPDSKEATEPPTIPVEVPAIELDQGEEYVTVVTRVAEVWPTVLEQENSGISAADRAKGVKAVWRAKYPPGGGSGSPQGQSGTGSTTTEPQPGLA